ncbi:hypothetical protein MUN82_01305 [Hymenobacter aerilatus]|uniref:Uncharacterized protein n=1 Tax=Hymenobacter aerilatus TaxID=2932251 RepID=A0A8T9SZT9_9BACT|nr:hypothetical protein [Hymenobacter aerilatus]UOR05750.1 hypothetical protein MUN82_01305 [Hymenobacter aerilatus]
MSTPRLALLGLLAAAASLSACNSTPADSTTAANADVVVHQDTTQRDTVPTMPAAVPSTEYTAPNTVVTESADSLHKK